MNYVKVQVCKGSKLNKVREISESILEKIDSGSLIEISENRALQLGDYDELRILSKMNVSGDERILWEIIARETYKLEQNFPLSSYIFLKELSGKSCEPFKIEKLSIDTLNEMGSRILGKNLGKKLIESFKIAGPNASIEVNEVDSKTFIVASDAIEFISKIPGEFGENITLKNVNFFVFDGIIEKVSDINRLLEELSQKNESAIIFSRGYGYEVVSTLLHNWKLGKLKVLPASTAGGLLDDFIFIDLPEIIGGNRIHVDDIWNDRAENLEFVEIKNGQIAIHDSRALEKACNLSKKILNDNHMKPSMKEYASLRSKNISSRKIIINVGTDYGGLKGVLKDRIQSFVRFVIFARSCGISIVNSGEKNIIIPSQSLIEAKKAAKSFTEVIKSMKVFIENDTV